ncbi:hypothetical protein LAZ67_1006848 [Cordylochernes scorpioides]|uniref:Uncharacterized protein n=1 Tax=Cordylochernes scorpioides TaxID=51811 RepID=A0ABY6JZ89_9ARAC|nr:hypothetical protein LAZ67_1006848 [Cordylochernes scorpioides]
MDKLKKACDLRSFAKKMEPGKVTKRKILSAAHSLFDPIGFTCPFTIIPKMLLQEKCLIQKAGWETDLSEDIMDKLKIPRCVVQSQDRRTSTLHVFMDSSNAAFAACAYLRSGFPGSVQVQLLMARSRVAPMKNITIPRLELVACEIGSRLAVHIKSMIEFEDIPITLWKDSTPALAWIKRDMNWSVFVAGRVKKIRQNSSITDWRHVPGKENPADIPSRGASISQLITTRWWEGPLPKDRTLETITLDKKVEIRSTPLKEDAGREGRQPQTRERPRSLPEPATACPDWEGPGSSPTWTTRPSGAPQATGASSAAIASTVMHVPDARCMSQTQDACPGRKMHVPDARCMSQTQDACPGRKMHVPDARCMSQTQDACPRRKMHVPDARCMSRTQDACPGRKMHVPDARCMSRTQDACPGRKMHVQDARCMSRTQDACPRRKMHVPDAICMSRTQDACPGRKMHVPDARCMSQTQDACPRRKMHVPDARCMSRTQDACPRRKMHVPDARCMSRTQDACPGRKMHVPDARCMSQTQVGQVRVARVKTSSGVFLRPVQRLFPLEIKQI